MHVRVGDKVFTVLSKTDIVPATPGQELQVVGVDYRLRDGETLEGKVANNGQGIAQGEFTQRYNKFSERWTPDRAGTYTLKFYADPEDRWVEENEDNNVIVVRLKVFNTAHEARDAGQRPSVWKWWSPESKPDKRYAAVRSRPRMALRASFANHRMYSVFSFSEQQRLRKTETPTVAPKANDVDAAFGSGFGQTTV